MRFFDNVQKINEMLNEFYNIERKVFTVKKNTMFKKVILNFHVYKLSYTMFLWGLSAVLTIVGTLFGTLYLILSILPIIAYVLLLANDRKNNSL